MKINNPHQNRTMKVTYIVISIVLLFLIVYGLIAYAKSLWPFISTDTTPGANNTTQITNKVNYNPPTNKEVQDSQSGKKNIPTNNKEADKSTQKNIAVGVSYAGITNDRKDRVEIRAFTPSIVEGDGTCTATLTKDSYVVTASSKAFVDSTTSQCEPIYIPVTRFETNGKWLLIVSYKSPSGVGSSDSVGVNI